MRVFPAGEQRVSFRLCVQVDCFRVVRRTSRIRSYPGSLQRWWLTAMKVQRINYTTHASDRWLLAATPKRRDPMPFVDTNELKVTEHLPGWKGRYYHSASMTFAHYEFAANSSSHVQFHSEEEVYEVIEGKLEGTIDGKSQVVKPGVVVFVPANSRHSFRASTHGHFLVVDHPVRPDFGKIGPLYMAGGTPAIPPAKVESESCVAMKHQICSRRRVNPTITSTGELR